MAKSIEALIEEAHLARLTVNNLFEAHDGWQANVRRGSEFFGYGLGVTAAEALQSAIEQAPAPKASAPEPDKITDLDIFG